MAAKLLFLRSSRLMAGLQEKARLLKLPAVSISLSSHLTKPLLALERCLLRDTLLDMDLVKINMHQSSHPFKPS